MQPQNPIARGPAVSPFKNAPDHPADPERDNAEQRGESESLNALAIARLGLVASHQDHANHVDLVTKQALLMPSGLVDWDTSEHGTDTPVRGRPFWV